MNTTASNLCRAVGFIFIALLGAIHAAHSQPAATTNAAIPLIPEIHFDNVPLTDAIKNLAREADLNTIIDPRARVLAVDVTGKTLQQEKTVTGRWQNTTARKMLDEVLRTHNMVMVENPVTTVARIALQDQNVKPVDRSLVGNDTNSVIPLIVMDGVPLNHAIQNLARQAQLQATFDPTLSGFFRELGGAPQVSVRWQKLTAKQALAALLDNYELTLVEDPAASTVTIKVRN